MARAPVAKAKRPSAPTAVAQIVTTAPPVSKPWTVDANLNTSSNLNSPSSSKNNLNSTFEAIGRYNLGQGTTLNAYGAVIKNHKGDRKSELQNAYGGATHRIHSFDDNKGLFFTEGRVYIPLNKDNRKGDGFITRLYAAPILSYTLGDFKTVLRSAFSKNFHEYQERTNGKVNTSHSLGNSITLIYTPAKWVSFDAYFLNTNSWSYYGNRRPDTFEMGQSIGLTLSENLGLTFGHVLGGNSFRSNGVDSNIRVFDRRDSTVYAELNVSF